MRAFILMRKPLLVLQTSRMDRTSFEPAAGGIEPSISNENAAKSMIVSFILPLI